jgi:hypothetical protein
MLCSQGRGKIPQHSQEEEGGLKRAEMEMPAAPGYGRVPQVGCRRSCRRHDDSQKNAPVLSWHHGEDAAWLVAEYLILLLNSPAHVGCSPSAIVEDMWALHMQ